MTAKNIPHDAELRRLARWHYNSDPVECGREVLERFGQPDMLTSIEHIQLLRECRTCLESLIAENPGIAEKVHGSTTVGNLCAELAGFRSDARALIPKEPPCDTQPTS